MSKVEGKAILKIKIDYLYSQSNVSDFVSILIANGYKVTMEQKGSEFHIEYEKDTDNE